MQDVTIWLEDIETRTVHYVMRIPKDMGLIIKYCKTNMQEIKLNPRVMSLSEYQTTSYDVHYAYRSEEDFTDFSIAFRAESSQDALKYM